jgi:hypothetical protein
MRSCEDDPAHYAQMTGLLRWRAGIVAISDMPAVFCISYPCCAEIVTSADASTDGSRSRRVFVRRY